MARGLSAVELFQWGKRGKELMGNKKNFGAGHKPEIEPSVFLTNLPGIVGFYPRGQVVIAALYRQQVEDLIDGKVEFDPTAHAGPMLIKDVASMENNPDLVRAAADFLLDEGCTHADVFIIDESWGIEKDSTPITGWLREGGLYEVRLAGVATIAAGEVVTDEQGEIVGIVGDSLMTDNANLISRQGEQIFKNYEEYRSYFRGGQFHDSKDRALIERLRERATAVEQPRKLKIGSDNPALIEHFDMLKTAVENVADGVMDAHEAVRDENAGYAIAAALTNVTLRDMSMIFITTQLAQSMGEIWREAAIVHRGSLRANALACFAIAKFAAGLENFAQTALDEAAGEQPNHSLTQLLEIAVANQIVPRCVGTILGAAQEVLRRVYKVKMPRID